VFIAHNEQVANPASSCIFLSIRLSGNNEADGNERMDTLGVLVLHVFCYHNHFRSTYDDRFTFETRPWSSDLYVRRMVRHIRVSAAVWAFSDDFMLCHHCAFFNRYDYMMRIVTNTTHQPPRRGASKNSANCIMTIQRGRGKCGTGKCRIGKCETNDVKFEGPKMQHWKMRD